MSGSEKRRRNEWRALIYTLPTPCAPTTTILTVGGAINRTKSDPAGERRLLGDATGRASWIRSASHLLSSRIWFKRREGFFDLSFASLSDTSLVSFRVRVTLWRSSELLCTSFVLSSLCAMCVVAFFLSCRPHVIPLAMSASMGSFSATSVCVLLLLCLR